MPWDKMTHSRTLHIYKDVLKDIIGGKQDVDLSIKGMLIRVELLKHDFTKRQLIIIMFIITFSFAYGKETAHIPKLQDFEIAGISKKHIKSELVKLIDMNVVDWDQEENLFAINDPRTWKAPYNAGYNDDRSQELIILNIQHAGIDVAPIIQKLKQMED